MKTLAFTAAIALGLAAVSTASAHECEFLCTGNGPQLTGIAPSAVKAQQPIIEAVTLPSGKTVDLR